MTDAAAAPANPPLLAALRADARALTQAKSTSNGRSSGLVDVLTLPGFWCVVLWRLSNYWHERGLRGLSRLTYFANMVIFGADLAPGAIVGPGVILPHPVGFAAASGVVFGARCKIMGMVRIGGSGQPHRPGFPVIEDDVWLLDSVHIFGPVTVGTGSVIGTSVILTEDVPPHSTVKLPPSDLVVRPRRVPEPSR